jgi:hypothetical protein
MRFAAFVGLGVAAVVAGAPAEAFQEQQAGAGAPSPAATATPEKAAPGKDLNLTTPPAALESAPGTEVRIPGLGKLGVLPKMDFGLELLYGASDAKQPDAAVREEPADDLTIRGTVKHNF